MFTKAQFVGIFLMVVLVLGFGEAAFAGTIDTPVSRWAFDETSGAIAHDSADGHNGTVNSAVWTTAGKIGGALDFDGVNDYVNFGDIDEFEFGTNDFSISLWFYTEGIHDTGPGNDGSHNGVLISKYSFSLGRQWIIGQAANGTLNFVTFETGNFPGHRLDTTTTFSNQWVHVTCTKAGSQMNMYINGILDQTGSCLGTITGKSTNVLVGAIQSGTTFYSLFNGKIDDVRIYDYALNANEVFELYQIPEPATLTLLGVGIMGLRRYKKMF